MNFWKGIPLLRFSNFTPEAECHLVASFIGGEADISKNQHQSNLDGRLALQIIGILILG